MSRTRTEMKTVMMYKKARMIVGRIETTIEDFMNNPNTESPYRPANLGVSHCDIVFMTETW